MGNEKFKLQILSIEYPNLLKTCTTERLKPDPTFLERLTGPIAWKPGGDYLKP